MAGIAGIHCTDGRPANLDELKRMTAATLERGADGVAYWNSGPVALAHLQFWTTPEAVDERQPLHSPGGEACLVWNGRIDNREELRSLIEAQGAAPVDKTDPGFVLAAYLLWGADCLQRLVGDFAFAIWDARHRRLWCARDYIGVRPFYYFWDGKTFVFGPEIRALLAHPLVSLKVNEGMAGEYLANAITSREDTLYENIRRLPGGCFLTVDGPGSLRIDSWWKPELSLLEYRHDEEYAEHFRELFDQSIRSRMRCNTSWGIQLSGGLDSSSIGVSARALLDAGLSSGGEIPTFSIACPGKPWDESEDIAAVVDKAGLTPEFLLPMPAGLEFFQERARFWRDFPGNPNGEPMTVPMYEAAKRRGVRVVLTGAGGDDWLDGDPLHLIDLAAGLLFGCESPITVRELLDRAKVDWGMYSGEGHWGVFLSRRLAMAAAPGWVRRCVRRTRLERRGIFSSEFLRRTNFADRLLATPPGEGMAFSSRAQKSTLNSALGAGEAHIFEINDREAAAAGLEARYPFFDRRLAGFCLRLPEDQRQVGAVRKRMLRNSMRGRLPERVRGKTGKAEFSELFELVFRGAQSSARLQNLAVRRSTDWFDQRRFEERIATLASPDHFGAWPLWMILGVDLWFEHLSCGVSVP